MEPWTCTAPVVPTLASQSGARIASLVGLLCCLLTSSREIALDLLSEFALRDDFQWKVLILPLTKQSTRVLPDCNYIIVEHHLHQTENNLCELVLQTSVLVHSFTLHRRGQFSATITRQPYQLITPKRATLAPYLTFIRRTSQRPSLAQYYHLISINFCVLLI